MQRRHTRGDGVVCLHSGRSEYGIQDICDLFLSLGIFLCFGLLTKFTFDGFNRHMFRKQRERAAVFAAAQVELGFLLQDQEDDAIF